MRLSSSILLIMLLASAFAAVRITIVRATGTIYIRADGSIDPPTAPITTSDNVTYILNGNISESHNAIVVERDNIVINGSGYVIEGVANENNGITISGRSNVTIAKTKIRSFNQGVCIVSSSDCTLSGNEIKNNDCGIRLVSSSYDNLLYNDITANIYQGIVLESSSNNTLRSNKVRNSDWGIYLERSSSNDISSGNEATNNERGFFLYNSSHNVLSGNNVTANNESGFYLCSYSNNNAINGNSISHNGYDGIRLSESSNNVMTGNSIRLHTQHNIELIQSSCNNTISGNDIRFSTFFGVRIYQFSNENTISGNNIYSNNHYGISLSCSCDNRLRNNSIAGHDYNFGVEASEWSTHTQFTHDVDSSNTVDGKPIYYWVGRNNMTVPSNAGYVALVDSTNITVQELNLENNGNGMLLVNVSSATVANNRITNNEQGMYLIDVNRSTIVNNQIAHSTCGVVLYSSFGNDVHENNVTDNYCGVYFLGSPSNGSVFYNNNFIDNTMQVDRFQSEGSVNSWDSGYPSGGNHWSDYNGTDMYGNQHQNETGSDGIGDTPYTIDASNADNYPLMNPWVPPDVSVIAVSAFVRILPVVVLRTIFPKPPPSFEININVTVQNEGNKVEGFNVTAYVNNTESDTSAYVVLVNGESMVLTFKLNTTGLAMGNYTVRAEVTPAPGELDVLDNELTDGWIFISIPGDINGDKKVDLKDVFTVAKAYGSVVGDPRYDPNLDINGDGKIDLKDYYMACKNFGRLW